MLVSMSIFHANHYVHFAMLVSEPILPIDSQFKWLHSIDSRLAHIVLS